jgi:hypothetical protein
MAQQGTGCSNPCYRPYTTCTGQSVQSQLYQSHLPAWGKSWDKLRAIRNIDLPPLTLIATEQYLSFHYLLLQLEIATRETCMVGSDTFMCDLLIWFGIDGIGLNDAYVDMQCRHQVDPLVRPTFIIYNDTASPSNGFHSFDTARGCMRRIYIIHTQLSTDPLFIGAYPHTYQRFDARETLPRGQLLQTLPYYRAGWTHTYTTLTLSPTYYISLIHSNTHKVAAIRGPTGARLIRRGIYHTNKYSRTHSHEYILGPTVGSSSFYYFRSFNILI